MRGQADQSILFFPEWGPLVTETRWNPNQEVYTHYDLIGFRVAPYDRNANRNGGGPPRTSYTVYAVERRQEEGDVA